MSNASSTRTGESHQPSGEKDVEVLDVRGKIRSEHRPLAKAIEYIGGTLASPTFFVVFLLLHLVWVVFNLPIWSYRPWDPYPFTFLATIASAEAPFIALLILMHQQRETHVNEVREEVDLQTSLHLEQEITMLLRMVREIQDHLGVVSQEDEVTRARLETELDPERLMDKVRRNLDHEEDESGATKS